MKKINGHEPLWKVYLLIIIVSISFHPTLFAQSTQVTGTVTASDTHEPLTGVNVSEKGTKNGTTTNARGEFILTTKSPDAVLSFTYVGFLKKDVPINHQLKLAITLDLDAKALGEVVVIGYGTVKKSDITGAVVSLKAGDLTTGPNINVQQALLGRAPGVQIFQKTGEPGAAMNVQIRGMTSIAGNNAPLYVIDGMPVNDASAIGGASPAGTSSNPNDRNPLNSLNPSDIESLEVLKDASATSIYGARGANGVVIITTKKGKAGKLTVSYDGQYGVQKVAKDQQVLTGTDYTKVINELIDYGNLDIAKVTGTNYNTDWQKQLERDGIIQSHDLAFSGGSGNTRFRASLGYFNQEGVQLKSATKRYNARVNLENSIAGKYAFGVNLTTSYSRDNYNASGLGFNDNGSALYMAQNYDPTSPVYNEDGSYYRSDFMNPLDNPVAVINGQYGYGDIYRTFGNIYAEYFILPELSAKVRVGGDINDGQRYYWIDPNTITGKSYNGYADVRDGKRGYYLTEGTLSYNKKFGQHSISAVAGATFERYSSSNLVANAQGFSVADLTYNAIGTGTTTLNGVSNGRAENKLLSYLGRANYSFRDKYLLTASLRVDGSARFGSDNRYGYFPSAAVAWKIHEEDFLKNNDVLSDLKLRVSYGTTGNQPNDNYLYFSTYSSGRRAVFDGGYVTSLAPSRSANPGLKWESAHQLDAGFDFAFLKSRITGSIEYYNRKTFNLLYDNPLPSSTGFSSQTQNIGSMRNTGWELALNGIVVDHKDFKLNAGFNITTLKNKVLSLGNNISQVITSGPGAIGEVGIIKPGYSMGSFYGYIVDGTWQTNDDFSTAQSGVRPGDVKYRDIDGSKTIDASDRMILGNSLPDFYYGFNIGARYKRFNLDIFFEGSHGFKIVNNMLVDSYYPVDFRRNKLSQPLLNRWTTTNPTNEYPSFLPNDVQGQRKINSKTVEDGSYLRLQSVRLSYNVAKSKTGFIKNTTLFVSGQNLFTITKYSGMDPSVNATGMNVKLDYAAYPLSRTFTGGINVQF